jgi:hypothetical protein
MCFWGLLGCLIGEKHACLHPDRPLSSTSTRPKENRKISKPDKNIDRGRVWSRLLWCVHMEWKETRSPSHPFAPATTMTHPSPWRSSAGRPTERCQKHSPEIQQKKCSHCWVLSRALHSPPLSLFTLSKVMVISNTSTIITLCQRTRSKQLNCHREALPPRVPCTVVVLLSYPLEGARTACLEWSSKI